MPKAKKAHCVATSCFNARHEMKNAQGRLYKNIHGEWTLGWYVGIKYYQRKGMAKPLVVLAHEMGWTHLFYGNGNTVVAIDTLLTGGF